MIKKLLACTGLAALCTTASALDITIKNDTDSTVVMAFSYLSSKENNWVAEGWFNVQPRHSGLVKLDSNNDLYYVYAEFSNGKRFEGGAGSLELNIANTAFFYVQSQVPPEYTKKVQFLKARANAGKATINVL